LIADAKTGQVMAEKKADDKQYVASLTKLLTALVAYQKTDLNRSVVVTADDVFSVSPVLDLTPGDEVTLLDLFNAMIVGSCNDAALALANHTADAAGQSFVTLMNDMAKQLGMNDSHFSNPLGFDSPGNYSTARDLLKLVLETQNFSAFTQLGKKTEYKFQSSLGNNYTAIATDKLVGKYPEIYAIKTGYTAGAGQAMITKIIKGDSSFFIIILGSKDREADTLKIVDELKN
jgi:D-alanyl-D-alanine carboxypeptidase